MTPVRRASELLSAVLGKLAGPGAAPRPDQVAAVDALVEGRRTMTDSEHTSTARSPAQ